MWFVEPINTGVHYMIENALKSGLQRAGIAYEPRGSYFKNHHTVQMLSVKASESTAAVEAIKEALAFVGLRDNAVIAIKTAPALWSTVHGYGNGGTNFGKIFLKFEDVATPNKILTAALEGESQMLSTMIEYITGLLGQSDQN